MMSTKRSLQSVTLVLVVFTVFTVSLTEHIQIADAGFSSQSTAGWIYELSPGESQVLTWTLKNVEEVPIDIEFRAEGKGSELFVFEKLVTMESKEKTSFEFIVTVPEDHPDNIEYRPDLFALEVSKQDSEGGAAILINYQMAARPVIKIGENPVFTPVPVPVVEEEPEPEPTVRPSQEDFEITPEETLEEKLARIQEANKETDVAVMGETPAEATGQFEVEDPVSDYVPEPGMDADLRTEINPVGTFSEKVECDFIAWFLSLFGMGKC